VDEKSGAGQLVHCFRSQIAFIVERNQRESEAELFDKTSRRADVFTQAFKNIDDVLWKKAGCTTEARQNRGPLMARVANEGPIDYRHGMQILRDARAFAPAIVFYSAQYHVFSRTVRLGSGDSIEAALEAAGYIPPVAKPSVLFVAVGANVVQGEAGVAVARSKTIALRVANAHNEYITGDRGY
jgi:hypothetical protein